MQPALEFDRLSVLIEDLLPSVRLASAGYGVAPTSCAEQCTPQLALHLILNAATPQLIVCSSSQLTVIDKSFNSTNKAANDTTNDTMGFIVAFEGPIGGLLVAEFIAPLVIELNSAHSCLLQAVALIDQELKVQRCGQSAMLKSSGDVLLICLLRHLVQHPPRPVGLFQGLADCRIAKTLVAMHGEPSTHWTLESLAVLAGMSRTAFAAHFSALMNISAGKYLENLRIAIAHHLVASGVGLKQAAKESGYASTSTLCRALNRH